MTTKKELEIRLEFINKNIEIYKKNAIEEIKKEQMIPATGDLLMLRDLKEQQGLIKRLIDEEEE